MCNRILKGAWLMAAACLPTVALAQQPAETRGTGTWEFSIAGGVKHMDRALLGYLSGGAATTRFTNTADPAVYMPVGVLRVGYFLLDHVGVSVGAEGTAGSGVTYLTPFAALTWTADLNARTSPFMTLGAQMTRIGGQNDRSMHPSWGAHVGVGIRQMVSERLSLRLEGRMALEHYPDLPSGDKAAYPSLATLGLSYFTGGRRAAAAPAVARAVPACPVCVPGRTRVDTVMRVRVDTLRVMRVDTVRLVEPATDQLVLRVQFVTDSTRLLRRTLPVLDSIARALIATPGSSWEVQGHTDNVGTAEHNRTLAQGRAQAVVDYLVRRGVPRGSLRATGFGEDRPVVSNATVEGRAQNRRVQLRRIPEGPPPGPPVP